MTSMVSGEAVVLRPASNSHDSMQAGGIATNTEMAVSRVVSIGQITHGHGHAQP